MDDSERVIYISILEKLTDIDRHLVEVLELKRMQILGIQDTKGREVPGETSTPERNHELRYWCERCQHRTYKKHLHTEIP